MSTMRKGSIVRSGFVGDGEPNLNDVLESEARRPSNVQAMKRNRQSVTNTGLTGASALTVRQSIFPVSLVTVLFFVSRLTPVRAML